MANWTDFEENLKWCLAGPHDRSHDRGTIVVGATERNASLIMQGFEQIEYDTQNGRNICRIGWECYNESQVKVIEIARRLLGMDP
jgi:hypothetical protein